MRIGDSRSRGRAMSNKPNWPGTGWGREIRSTKLEIRDRFEMRIIETGQSAPNEPNLVPGRDCRGAGQEGEMDVNAI